MKSSLAEAKQFIPLEAKEISPDRTQLPCLVFDLLQAVRVRVAQVVCEMILNEMHEAEKDDESLNRSCLLANT